MVSINTNLQSLLVQQNLAKSTNALNTAIERMTTGYKLNHASDNAAGYSIAENMVSQLSSYDVASDNISAGMDMVSTAQESIALMQSHAERIHNLITQAQNGTYGENSIAAINSEIQARIDEINRIYETTEYNGISLLKCEFELSSEALAIKSGTASVSGEYGEFISNPVTHSQDQVDALTHVADVSNFVDGTSYQVSTINDLRKLADLVNSGVATLGITFVMGADIDLSGESWTPIGDYSTNSDYKFMGVFDGNGHNVTHLNISNPDKEFQGLFGYANIHSSIKNVGVEGSVSGSTCTGGLIGMADGALTNCYSKVSVNGGDSTGGLVGRSNAYITNCYATGNVTGNDKTGGLVGYTTELIKNCFATGTVTGQNNTGGLVGLTEGIVEKSKSTGSSSGKNNVGGLAGKALADIKDCFSSSITSGEISIGGLIGLSKTNTVSNCCSTGSVSGNKLVGGLIGNAETYDGNVTVKDSISYSTVRGQGLSGAFIGGNVGWYEKVNNGSTIISYGNGSLSVTSCEMFQQDISKIGGWAKELYNETNNTTSYIYDSSHDLTPQMSNIGVIEGKLGVITLQIGINGDESSRLDVETRLNYNLNSIIVKGAQDSSNYVVLNDFLDLLSEKSTKLGAVTNRLESALDTTTTAIEKLTGSLSTIRDADIATESSNYIKAQILQQASSTLLSTANQAPSVAIQLL